jgi:type IV pilus assembly protein PilQ
VTGKVTLTLEHPVPWDQVLDLVLKMNQLGKTMEGNIIRIATQDTLDAEEEQKQERLAAQRSVQDQEKALEPLITEYIPVSYSDAATEIQPHLEKIVTKDRGSLSVDKRTNMVILTDTAGTIKQAREIVEKLDRVTPQVLIEARIVEATTNFSREIGTNWGLNTGINESTVAAGAEAQPGIGPQRAYNMLGGTYGTDIAVNLPVNQFGSIGFNFLRIAGTPFLLNAMLMAMESKEEGRIISAPRILTLDNKPALISQGFEYPYQTRDEDGQTQIEFKDVNLELNVTPHITPDNRISMKVQIQNNDIFTQTADGPALSTNEASTELLVNDGDTFVIGGIIRENETTTNDGLPGLSRIPLLGWLFKSRVKSQDKRELLIFITPRIVQLEQRQMQL